MEEKQYAKSHRLLLNNRRTGTVSGVTDVISFDIAEILLETEQGMLTIKGADLHVNRLTHGLLGSDGFPEDGSVSSGTSV